MSSARKLRVWGGTRQRETGGASPRAGRLGGEVEAATVTRLATRRPTRPADDARYARLFEKFQRPAKSMVRSAFGTAFSEDELDDFYSSAWLSTLAAFERKPRDLADDELRRYVMTAVANQASRELRRRGRKPTIPLDVAPETSDGGTSPDEAAARTERARLTREVLGSLSPRRRAVLVYRYGWDLDPSEVCDLVDGLSPRAYRKEIERGVAEVAKKMRLVEEGGWCDTREPLLRAVVAGTADDDQRRQANQHLSNCRRCAGFVGSLNGHLHELGGGLAIAALAAYAEWEEWLNLAVGYGAHNMLYARDSQSRFNGFDPYRQYYFSIDLDLTAVRTRSKFLKTVIFVLNTIKIPAPTVEFSRKGNAFHLLGF